MYTIQLVENNTLIGYITVSDDHYDAKVSGFVWEALKNGFLELYSPFDGAYIDEDGFTIIKVKGSGSPGLISDGCLRDECDSFNCSFCFASSRGPIEHIVFPKGTTVTLINNGQDHVYYDDEIHQYKGVEIINLTPDDLIVCEGSKIVLKIPPSGTVASFDKQIAMYMANLGLVVGDTKVTYGYERFRGIQNLPKIKEGVLYYTFPLVAQVAWKNNRFDVVCSLTNATDAQGNVIGITGFAFKPPLE